MSDSQLDRILMEYDLDSSDSRHYRGMRRDFFPDEFGFGSSKVERRRTLIVLFEFLGAHQLAEYLRLGRHTGLGVHPRALSTSRLLLDR